MRMQLGLNHPAASPSPRAFEEEWPALARRLNSMLAGKRIPATKREDIVQETGLRLFRMWDAVDPERPVWALAVTIALNLVRDEARRGIGREVLGTVPDRANPHDDVERSGLARVELGRVERALAELAPDHRSILLAEVGDAEVATDRGPNAVKMLRMRARRRLNTLLDTASAGSAAFVGRVRKSLGLDSHLYMLQSATGTHQTQMPYVAGFLAVMSILGGMSGGLGIFSEGGDPTSIPGRRNLDLSMSIAAAENAAGFATEAALPGELPALRRVSTLRKPKDYDPYRLHVPQGAGFLEGEGEIGVLGLGIQMGDKGGTPACVFGVPERSMGPGELMCTSPAKGGREGEVVYARGKARGRLGPLRWQVEI